MGTDVVQAGFTDPNAQFDYDWRLAQIAHASGLYPDVRKAEEAMGKILLGRALGLDGTQSLIGIYMVEGKPMVAATTLAAFVRKLPGYDYRVKELTDEKCSIEFTRDGELLGLSEFSMEDAKRAGLVRDRSGWVKYPRNMLFARAMSNGVRWFAPDATHGTPVYHEGEIEAGAARVVDGVVEGEASAEPLSLSEVAEAVPEGLRGRFVEAFEDAQVCRPGMVTLAGCLLAVEGQSSEAVECWLEGVERANDESRPAPEGVVDAEVVVGDAERPVEGSDVDVLRRRLELLRAQQPDVPEELQDEVAAEIDQLEEELRSAGVHVPLPGQGALDV